MSSKLSHLEMIQGIVNRLSQNSFLLEGWTVVLVSGLFALAASETKILFVYLAYLPAAAFWLLDAYFLRQERLYHALYNRVRAMDEADIDFSMSTERVASEVASGAQVVGSKTIVGFHLTVVAAIVAVMIVSIIRQ